MAMSLCIFLFCTLKTFSAAVTWGLKSASASRLVTRHAVSLIFRLPVSDEDKIRALPGVRSVAIRSFFGGIYRDPKNFFSNVAIEAEPYLAMYPGFLIAPDQKQAFLQDMRGCVVGPGPARRLPGDHDTFQMDSYIPYYRAGKPYEFVVRPFIPRTRSTTGTNDYSCSSPRSRGDDQRKDERARRGRDVRGGDRGSRAGGSDQQASRRALREPSAQTRTETESAFRSGMVSLSGNLALLLTASRGGDVTILVTANTMSMAVRERRTEIAVLKTLGFSSARVMA
jgi:putative ABC transport system permease protein